MHGNVWEWVQDCGPANDYAGAPRDGSPVEPKASSRAGKSTAQQNSNKQQQKQGPTPSDQPLTASCSIRLLRGGAWNNGPTNARSANRFVVDPANRNDNTGLRLTRMLP